MKIDLELMYEARDKQRKRDYSERGMQPLLMIECFVNLGNGKRKVRTDRYCLKCKNYETCRMYLIAFQKEEILFGRGIRVY